MTTRFDTSSLRADFSGRLLTDESDTAAFLTDWRGRWTGSARCVVQPDTVADVAAVVRWCAARGIPIVPQGGNTGLSGGSIPDGTGTAIVLSLRRLGRIREVDVRNSTITAEAGCILRDVQEAADRVGKLFPLSLAAEGSCTIGGNLATNAGGTSVLRYGNARELCLGLEVVTPDGQIWDGLKRLRKNNAGYDLRDVFVGSEGTLGVITAAVLRLYPRPKGRAVALLAVDGIGAATDILDLARDVLDSRLTGFELFSDACLDLVLRHNPGLRPPVTSANPWYVLVEVSDTASFDAAEEALSAFTTLAFDRSLVADGVVAGSLSQSSALWALRESISESQGREGPVIKHDIALPISRIAAFAESTEHGIAARWPWVRLFVFGHLGDGNLHYNLSPAAGTDAGTFLAAESAINRFVHDAVVAAEGSISAEHGLGVLRRDEAARYMQPIELALMRSLKQAFDPIGLMNPGKVLSSW